MNTRRLPRLVIAGIAGDSGKTVVSVGLALAIRDRGIRVAGFKKGPDYIDAAWLTWAAGRAARNLDTYLMGRDIARASFVARGIEDGINLIEGNRGVYDGVDASGTHSTAELAKLLDAPVVLVLDATKVTRTAAALVLGCQTLDRDVRFAGVILNRIGSDRHERVVRDAIESACHLPVLGVVRRIEDVTLLRSRHLGLVTPEEHGDIHGLRSTLRAVVDGLDLDRLLAVARNAPPLEADASNPAEAGCDDASEAAGVVPRDTKVCQANAGSGFSRICRVGYLADSAFTFYYPENLEALEAAGATLVPVSSLTSCELPRDLHALYIGGGFPETHAARLASNASFLQSLSEAAARGLPVYAECGGLMLLSSAIRSDGRRHPMAGVLPIEVEMQPKPAGHGYTRLIVDAPNPFFADGTVLEGHEFHYSHVVKDTAGLPTACAVVRGTGCLPGRDGVLVNHTFASYTHLHALATPQWAPGLVSAARGFARR